MVIIFGQRVYDGTFVLAYDRPQTRHPYGLSRGLTEKSGLPIEMTSCIGTYIYLCEGKIHCILP